MAERDRKSRLHLDDVYRGVYSTAACIYRREPEGVFFPTGESDLLWILERARINKESLTARGAGSGLAGQTVGNGYIVDSTTGMSDVLKFSSEEKRAIVQPGVVLTGLNRSISPYGLRFSPDPSSQDFCTIGGMLSNNSKGPHAFKYGSTLDHAIALKVLLPDGERVLIEKKALEPSQYTHPGLKKAASLIDENRELILNGWPECNANSSGYNLKDCLTEDGRVNLLPLFIGSEGTLGFFLEAELNLMEVPGYRSMALLMFGDVVSAGAAVENILPLYPSACEILDETFLQIIRDGGGQFPLPVDPAARTILVVETEGRDIDETEAVMDSILERGRDAGSIGSVKADTPDDKEKIWAFRKAASPLLNKGRGRLKSTRFIEDGSVPTIAIPDYLKGITAILSARKMRTVIFGHAGAGNFHVNPFVDLKDPNHFRQIPLIAQETAELIANLGGCLTGEHGDGRLRTPYLPVVYGEEITLIFRKIKLAIDPEEIFNPGIIAPDPEHAEKIDDGIRYSPSYRITSLPGRLSEESWAMEIERCHGCGNCRDFCPTASVTHMDTLSSRGRANILQALLGGLMDSGSSTWKTFGSLYETCLGCSQCAEHCPTGVDIAPLAAAFKEAYSPGSITESLLGALPSLGYKTGSTAGRIAARVASSRVGSVFGRKLLGVDVKGQVPLMAKSFAFDPQKLYRFESDGDHKALLFYGCYGNTYAPEEGAGAALKVLNLLGVDTVVPPQACCGISKLMKGMVDAIASDVFFNRRVFIPWVEAGYVPVVNEPSCLLALSKEQPRFFPSKEGDAIASGAMSFFSFIKPLIEARQSSLNRVPMKVVYQRPCHSEATGTWRDEVDVLRMIPDLEILDVTEECCGMAGSYGLRTGTSILAESISDPLMKRIRKTNPQEVVTPCGSCAMQIRSHVSFPVHTPLYYLARSLTD